MDWSDIGEGKFQQSLPHITYIQCRYVSAVKGIVSSTLVWDRV